MKIIVDGEGTEILQAPGRIKTYPHSRGSGKVHALRRHYKGSKITYSLCVDVKPEQRAKWMGHWLKYHSDAVDPKTAVTCLNCLRRAHEIKEIENG